MAATIAKARGYHKDGRPQAGQKTALGHGSAEGQANTWRTFTTCFVSAAGSGFVEVKRDHEVLHRFDFEAES